MKNPSYAEIYDRARTEFATSGRKERDWYVIDQVERNMWFIMARDLILHERGGSHGDDNGVN